MADPLTPASRATWTLDGRNISEHPDYHAAEYRKVGTVLAATAHMDGIVETPEGTMACPVIPSRSPRTPR